MNKKFQFEMLSGPTVGKLFPIDKDQIVVGRDPSCDIVINDSEVSRKHFRLVWKEPGYMLEDMGSTNGVIIDEEKISSSQGLHGGEILNLGGNTILEYKVIEHEEEDVIIPEKDAIEDPEPMDDPQEPSAFVEEEPMIEPDSDLTRSRPRMNKYVLTALIIVIFIIIALIFVYLYQAPTSFWCKTFSFYFKPEIYPECVP
ncbi:FHA domain-containing protein [Chloroflexota bacterium]